MKLIFVLLFTVGCIPYMRESEPEPLIEDIIEPELNNVVTKKLWDFCCRICMKKKSDIRIVYDYERDVMSCQCADGNSAEITIKD